MTAKRFTLKGLIEGVPNICDNDEIIEQEEAVMLLNKLHEEKEIDEKCYKELLQRYDKLKEENEQLKKELNAFKPVMFQDMRKGTVILYRKGDYE